MTDGAGRFCWMKIRKLAKIGMRCLAAGVLLCAMFVGLSNWIIEERTTSTLFSDINTVPVNEVGIILGTSKYVYRNLLNLYFRYRIEAAVALFKAGKIKKILVSGDNGSRYYDEPTDMKNALVAAGIPADVIFLDYAGFRTLDSMIRAKEIFGLDRFTVISQQFHNQRAVFTARHFSIAAVGYNARNVYGRYALKTNIREKFARAKTIIDLYLLHTAPRFLGKKEKIL
jgi:SanA protein